MTTARATYTYPKAGDFHAGAFDLDRFQVYDTGSTVTFRVQTANSSPPPSARRNGVQLVDVYVSQTRRRAHLQGVTVLPGDELFGLSPVESLIDEAGLR
jgi:hypothetical protein